MMIDEPVFGHDPPSAARVVIRLLRWRRRQESLRWFEHAILGQGVALRLVVDRESPVGTTQPTQPPNVVVNPDPRATVAPVPVQLVIASHQPHALEIAAELEGTELDHDLRAALRELVPAQWRSRVRDALQNCRERLTEFEATTELPACIPYALPSQGLRALWRIPDSVLPADSNKEDDSKDKEDWGQWKAVATLERLGLHHLADRLKESVEHDGPARAARRLLTWLVWNDLLIAAFEGAEHGFDLGGVSLRELSANGGVAYEIGPTRLRRIGAMLEVLPPLAVTEAGTEPASHLVPEPRSALAVPEPGVPQPAREAPQVSPPVPDASEASPPVRDAPEASPPVRNAPSLGIWRVAIVGADGSLREEIPRRAGALRPHAGEAADLLVHLDASSSGYRFRAEDGSFSGGATKDDWRDGEPLARAIAYRRAEHLASHQPEEREVEVLVWTHGDDPVPSPNLAFSVGARLPDPPLLDSRVMEIWRTRIDAPLVRLRDALGRSAKTRWLKFWPLCTPGAAIRIGSLFHHQSRFSVICDQAGAVWDLDRQPTPPTSAPALSIQPFGADDDAREEVHLLIGMSAAVYDRYRAWQQGSTGMKPARALVVEPIGGPSRTSVPAGMVVDWAEYVFRPTRSLVAAVRARRAHTQQPPSVDLRIFCAAPTGFAIAFGRSLNATGRIVTMDLVSGTDAYVPTFDFRA